MEIVEWSRWERSSMASQCIRSLQPLIELPRPRGNIAYMFTIRHREPYSYSGNSYASRCCCHRPRCVYAANSEWTLIVIIIPQTYIYIEKMTVQMWFFPLCINYNWNFTILFHFWRDHNFFNWTSGGPTTAAMEFPSKSVCLAIIISCRWSDHLRHSLPGLSGFRVHLILHLQSRMKLFASPLEWIPLFTYSFSLATKSLKCIGNYEYMRCYPPYDRDNSNR